MEERSANLNIRSFCLNWVSIRYPVFGFSYPDNWLTDSVWPVIRTDQLSGLTIYPDSIYCFENSWKRFENSLKPLMYIKSGKNCRFENNYGFENSCENSYRLKSVTNPDNCKFRQSVIRIQFKNCYGLKTVTRIENNYLSVIESG